MRFDNAGHIGSCKCAARFAFEGVLLDTHVHEEPLLGLSAVVDKGVRPQALRTQTGTHIDAMSSRFCPH